VQDGVTQGLARGVSTSDQASRLRGVKVSLAGVSKQAMKAIEPRRNAETMAAPCRLSARLIDSRATF